MSLPLIVRTAAAAEIDEAFRWYEHERLGLGGQFLGEVQTLLQAIEGPPLRFPVIYRETRRALLPRFPYCVFYRMLAERIVVVACFHAKRDPKIWKMRS